MAGVDEELEIIWCAKTAGSRKVARYLIAPGAVKRVFGNGQQFDVGVVHFLGVGNELFRQLAVCEPFPAIFQPPGAKMHFVDVDGCIQGVALWYCVLSV